MPLIGSRLTPQEKVHRSRGSVELSHNQPVPSPDYSSLPKASPSSLSRARWHQLPCPPVNRVPRTHPNITPGSERTQPKQKYLSSRQQCGPHLETLFFHVNPVPKRGGVGCADPETVLRMLLPPVYHRTPHLAHGQAVTALRQQAL